MAKNRFYCDFDFPLSLTLTPVFLTQGVDLRRFSPPTHIDLYDPIIPKNRYENALRRKKYHPTGRGSFFPNMAKKKLFFLTDHLILMRA